jgi:hypothetical protein
MDKNSIIKFLVGSQIVLIVIILLTFRSCRNNEIEAQNNKLLADTYFNETQKFKSERDKLGRQVVEQEQVIISKDKEIENKLLENSNLKKLNSQIKISFETKIKNIIAEYEGKNGEPIYVYSTDTIHDTIPVPIGVKFGTMVKASDQWYNFAGTINKGGLSMDSLSFTNKFTITVGQRREGIFKPLKSYVEVQSENPYTTINGLNNIKVIEKKSIWSKPWFNFLIGTAAGSILTTGIVYGVK